MCVSHVDGYQNDVTAMDTAITIAGPLKRYGVRKSSRCSGNRNDSGARFAGQGREALANEALTRPSGPRWTSPHPTKTATRAPAIVRNVPASDNIDPP